MNDRTPMRVLPGPEQVRRMTTDELRAAFLVTGLFVPGQLNLEHVDLDRVVLGGAVPTDAPLRLEAPGSLGASFFLERRELGVLNIGGDGAVVADGTRHDLSARDVVYLGRGTRDVTFESRDAKTPARFYLVSYPAYSDQPAGVAREGDAQGTAIGSAETANARRVARYIHQEGVRSSQLVMGVTRLATGSVWNTMPAHTHHRRTEVYLYFDVPQDAVVLHLMGEPHETRHLVVRDGEVALSPIWSVHSGAGTTNYSFCWAMGGENQDYADMQPVPMNVLR